MASLLQQMKVERKGVRRQSFQALYYLILKMSWFRFISYIISIYVFLNLFFAILLLLSPGSIANVPQGSLFEAFIFSVQSFATIGYGYYLPQTTMAHLIIVAESITSLIFTAIVTGLTFAKFSRPHAHVIFSKKIVITKYEGVPTIMFRIGNGRDTNIIDAKISLTSLSPHRSQEGISMQKFVDLKLERSHSPFFILTWTVMHKIDSQSPFFGMTPEDFKNQNINLFVSMLGFDETYFQTIHSAWRYQAEDFFFNKKFVDVIDILPDGTRQIDFDKFHQIEDQA